MYLFRGDGLEQETLCRMLSHIIPSKQEAVMSVPSSVVNQHQVASSLTLAADRPRELVEPTGDERSDP
jgi:hypothetical protein